MPNPIATLLGTDDAQVSARWRQLEKRFERQFGRGAGVESALFLIGVQARGRGYEPALSKEGKQDLIMEGTYRAFETLGLYRRVVGYQNGRTLWEKTASWPPSLSIDAQEKLLKLAILGYFDTVWPDLPPVDSAG
jgi:hypothetical protein